MGELWRRAVRQLKRLRTQVFLAYFAVLTPCFIVMGVGLVLAARQLMIQQIGTSRLDMLRQIGERANTVKTSATTLVDLYRYEDVYKRQLCWRPTRLCRTTRRWPPTCWWSF